MTLFLETIGWVGACAVLGAYGLLSAKKLPSDSYWYHGLNIIGSLCLAIYAAWKGANASVMVNVVWLGIGIAAVYGLKRASRLR